MPKPEVRPKGHPGPVKPAIRSPIRAVGARFVASVAGVGEVPAGPPEIAMCGRSNVGKSSLINALCNHKALARISRTPGRTQRVNLFDLDLATGETLRLVDLPGFGHARAPGAVRDSFSPMIQAYLLDQDRMAAVVLLLDARRDTDEDAIGFAQWLVEHKRPVAVVMTKADQVPKNRRFAVQVRLQREYGLSRPPPAVSVTEDLGIDELLHMLRALAFPNARSPRKPGPRKPAAADSGPV